MNKHIEKAMELRNETPMVSNCSQTIMRCYAEDMVSVAQSQVV